MSSPPYTHLSFLLLLLLFAMASLAAARPSTPLVRSYCNQTSDPSLCEAVLDANPNTPRARDGFTLASIAVRLAYVEATSTRDYIKQLLNNPQAAGGGRVGQQRLAVCESRYGLVVEMLVKADEEINDDTYSNLAYLAKEAKGSLNRCEAAFSKSTWQPMGNRNMVMAVLCEVIAVIGVSVAGPP